MTCTGCHEDKMAAPPTGGTPMASKRPASKMEPELGKVEPISYARVISPILTKKCFPCHQGKTGTPTNAAYNAMEPYSFWFASAGDNRVKGHGGSRSKAGQIGARGSRMGKALLSATHQQAQTDGKFTELEARTLYQWLDLGSDELGSFDNEGAQRRGELVWPTLDFDKNDPQGVKYVPETPYVERKDAGVPSPDLPKADAAPRSDASPSATGGSTSTGGTVATGGQAGAGSTPTGGSGSGGKTSAGGSVASGGQPGSGGAGTPGLAASGGQTGSGGGTVTPGPVATGGSGAGSQTPVGRVSGSGCRMGAESSTSVQAWILLLAGIALFARGRRRPR
jgi:MYXO-CTERM domain-containing protein